MTKYLKVACLAIATLFTGCDFDDRQFFGLPGPVAPEVPNAPDPTPDPTPDPAPEPGPSDPAPAGAQTIGNAAGDSLTVDRFLMVPGGSERYLTIEVEGTQAAKYEVIVFMRGAECQTATIDPNRVYDSSASGGAGLSFSRALGLSDFTGLLAEACVHGVYKPHLPDGGGKVSWGIPVLGQSFGAAGIYVIWQYADGSDRAFARVEVRVP